MKQIINHFELDFSKAFKDIEEKSPKKVLIQLPDGFKYSSKQILDKFKQEFPKIVFYSWLNTNFGSCDIPLGLEKLNFDMIIHFGHAQWK